MEKLYFLFLLIFVQINSQIKENPILLIDGKNPFVLSTNDNDDYYYVMTHKKYLKINKDTGMLESVMDSILNESEYYFYISDNLYKNYLFHSERYFEIIFNNSISFISLQEISFHSLKVNDQSKMIKVGGIVKNDDLIIYGFSNLRGDIFFASKSRENYASIYRDNLNDKLSCKFIEEESFICAMNFDSYFIYIVSNIILMKEIQKMILYQFMKIHNIFIKILLHTLACMIQIITILNYYVVI